MYTTVPCSLSGLFKDLFKSHLARETKFCIVAYNSMPIQVIIMGLMVEWGYNRDSKIACAQEFIGRNHFKTHWPEMFKFTLQLPDSFKIMTI
jgi:hypothetical protein